MRINRAKSVMNSLTHVPRNNSTVGGCSPHVWIAEFPCTYIWFESLQTYTALSVCVWLFSEGIDFYVLNPTFAQFSSHPEANIPCLAAESATFTPSFKPTPMEVLSRNKVSDLARPLRSVPQPGPQLAPWYLRSTVILLQKNVTALKKDSIVLRYSSRLQVNRFFRHDKETLRFKAVWDDPSYGG